VERFPQDADSHVLRSNAFLFAAWEKDRTSPEIAAFEASLMAIDRADPANPWDEVFRAFARQRGEPRESVEEFSKVLDRADLTPAARGFVLGLRGDARALYYDFTNALSDLNKSLELDPANDVNYMLLATVLLRSGRIEESLKRASQAMALDPSSPMNNFALGLALLETGRNEDSLPPMRSACEVSSVYCVGYGRALSLAGHTDQALPRLAESCASRAPTCIEYACALARAGRLYEARAAAAKATDLPGNDWFAYTKAGFLALVGDRAEAIRTLKGAVSSGLLDGCIGRNPDFAPLRDEPEFRAIVAEVERRIRSD
jgi:tetratricopeptide (TPR) repeat protein